MKSYQLPSEQAPKGVVVFFDGECPMCQRFVQRLLANSSDDLKVGPTQGDTFQKMLPEEFRDHRPDSMVVVTPGGAVMTESQAIKVLLKKCRGPLRWLGLFISVFPQFLTDSGYHLIATNRKKMAKKKACSVPPPEYRHRILP